MCWHDGSSLANHGHLMIMVSLLYDPAMYYTDEEYEAISGKRINLQSIIERPNLYILARCPSNDQQIMYSDTRMEDILSLKKIKTKNGILIEDIIRVFKGDAPASQFEAGHQKGGNFFLLDM